MASDDEQLFISGCAKLKEFELLSYPKHLRTYGCAVMAKGTVLETLRGLIFDDSNNARKQ